MTSATSPRAVCSQVPELCQRPSEQMVGKARQGHERGALGSKKCL